MEAFPFSNPFILLTYCSTQVVVIINIYASQLKHVCTMSRCVCQNRWARSKVKLTLKNFESSLSGIYMVYINIQGTI